jgi:hypothetical protein
MVVPACDLSSSGGGGRRIVIPKPARAKVVERLCPTNKIKTKGLRHGWSGRVLA